MVAPLAVSPFRQLVAKGLTVAVVVLTATGTHAADNNIVCRWRRSFGYRRGS